MARKVEVQIVGDARSLERAFGRAQTRSTAFGAALHKLGQAAIYAGAALAAGLTVELVKSVRAAVDAEASQARLTQAFKDAGVALKSHLAGLERVESASRKLGFADTEVRDSLGSLIVASHNYQKAITDLGVAQDLSRFKHLGLTDATKMLTMAMTGSQRAAKQLGIVVIPTTAHVDALKRAHVDLATAAGKAELAHAKLQDKMALGQAVIDQVTAKTHGQAQAFASSAAGGMAQFSAQWEHLPVQIGKLSLPVVVQAMAGASRAVDFLQQTVTRHGAEIRAVFSAVGQEIRIAFDNYAVPALRAFHVAAQAVASAIAAHWPQIRATALSVGQVIRANFALARAAINAFMPLVRALAPLFKVGFGAMLITIRVWAAVMATSARIAAASLRAVTPVVRVLASVLSSGLHAGGAAARTFAGVVTSAMHAVLGPIHAVTSAIRTLWSWLKRVENFTIHIHIPTPHIPHIGLPHVGIPHVGNPFGAAGGVVMGGMKGRDSVPAVLMPGEVVVPVPLVQKHGGAASLMDKLGFQRMAAGGVAGKPKHHSPRVPGSIRESEARAAGTPQLTDDISAYGRELAWVDKQLARRDLTASERESLKLRRIRLKNRLKSLRSRQSKRVNTDVTPPASIRLAEARARLTTPLDDDIAAEKLEIDWLKKQLAKPGIGTERRIALTNALADAQDTLKGLLDQQSGGGGGAGGDTGDLQAQLDQALARLAVAQNIAAYDEAFVGTGIFGSSGGGIPGGGGSGSGPGFQGGPAPAPPTIIFQNLIPDAAQILRATSAIARGAGLQPYRSTSLQRTGY